MEETKKPFRRDYLKEAYLIARGDQKLGLKRQHVEAAIEALTVLARDFEAIRNVMRVAYQESCKRREQNGLPPAPEPPVLQPSFELPWSDQNERRI